MKLGVILKEEGEGFLQVIVMRSALYIEFTATGQSDTQRGEKKTLQVLWSECIINFHRVVVETRSHGQRRRGGVPSGNSYSECSLYRIYSHWTKRYSKRGKKTLQVLRSECIINFHTVVVETRSHGQRRGGVPSGNSYVECSLYRIYSHWTKRYSKNLSSISYNNLM